MHRTKLGKTGLEISRLGLGAWAIGGNLWGPQDDADSIATIHHAVASGINWIDTAAMYGNGHSETVIGLALKQLGSASRPLVFTKGGLFWKDGERVRSGTRDSLKLGVEQSLKRLCVEAIDLYQMHWPASDVPLEEYWQTLLDLRDEGKVRHVGLSNHDADQLRRCEAICHVETLQPPFSMIRRDAGDELLPWSAAHGTGVIVYSPMQSGLLTGAFDRQRLTKLDPDDFRRKDAQFMGDAFERNMQLIDALRPIAARRGITVGSLALGWVLAWPSIGGAIVGARRPDQIDGWTNSADLRLDRAEMEEIAAAIDRSGAGTGPLIPELAL